MEVNLGLLPMTQAVMLPLFEEDPKKFHETIDTY